jgi:hypothetical protein
MVIHVLLHLHSLPEYGDFVLEAVKDSRRRPEVDASYLVDGVARPEVSWLDVRLLYGCRLDYA